MKRVRVFSVWRLLLSVALGLLIPLGYAYTLHLAQEATGWRPTEPFLMPFAWPRPVWIFLMGRPVMPDDFAPILLFAALGNVALYGTLAYVGLTLVPLFRRRGAAFEPPPLPGGFDAPRETNGI